MPSLGTGGPPETIPSTSALSVSWDDFSNGELIGQGGNADVYQVTVTRDGNAVPVAIKQPRFQGTLHSDAIDRFRDEVQVWYQLDDHDHIVSLFDGGTDPLPWLAMEYMDGGNLESFLNHGRLPIKQALWVGYCICQAVHYAHRHGVAHHDLKPANILFRQYDDSWMVPKVSDWGLARMMLDETGSVDGLSPHYSAPEQFDAGKFGSPNDQTDIYQIGTVLYELLTGRPPFEGSMTEVMQSILSQDPTPPSNIADLPTAVDEVIMPALEKEQAARYDSIVYLRDGLKSLFGSTTQDTVEVAKSVKNGSHTSNESSKTKNNSGQQTQQRASPEPEQTRQEATNTQSSAKTAATAKNPRSLVNRRSLLAVLGTGAVGLGGWRISTNTSDSPLSSADNDGDGTVVSGGNGGDESEYPSLGNYPIEGDTAVLGFNVPQTGPYQEEGADELRAYELAVDHLNNGGGWVDMWDDLSGDGVNGYEIDYVTGDTATDADTARESASRMIERDNVIMFSGGSSSATAIAQQGLAQQNSVLFMCCLTHSNDTTGGDCVRYGFREMFNAYITGQALAPVVTEEYGEDLEFYQLYADYTWGQTQQESMRQFFEEAGWSEVDSVPTPLGSDDYSTFLQEAVDSGADVLFLNHYGLDGSNSVSQAIDQGINEDMEIVVPLYNVPMAEDAGDAFDGIYGTADWDVNLNNEPTQAFVDAFEEEYGSTPSSPARLAYSATLQYAAAVERAGTFYPPEVIRELEGYEWNNGGIGEEIMRKCDHQTMRDILVVRGLPEGEQDPDSGRYWEVVEQATYPDDVGYECGTGPAAECELGDYGDE